MLKELIILPQENNEKYFKEFVESYLKENKLDSEIKYKFNKKNNTITISVNNVLYLAEDYKQVITFILAFTRGYYFGKEVDKNES